MINFSLKQLWILGWCLWILAACQPSSTSQSIATAEASFPTQTVDTPSSKVVDFPTLTPTATPDVIMTSISTSTPTPAPTTTSTPSPLPPLSAAEALATVTMLYETNRECMLPCWWGFTPGQTDWIIAKEFLTPFADAIYEGIDPPTPLWNVEIYLPNTFYTDLDAGRSIIHNYSINEEKINAFEVRISEPSSLFTPMSILNTYGKPAEVYLRTWQGGTGYLLTFFYPQFGFRITYQVDGGTNENGIISACFQEGLPWLTIWTPDRELTFSETYELFHREDSGQYQLPLNIATGMDVPTFYETFSDSDVSICLETPTNLWPGF
jgi:hypothetical protein